MILFLCSYFVGWNLWMESASLWLIFRAVHGLLKRHDQLILYGDCTIKHWAWWHCPLGQQCHGLGIISSFLWFGSGLCWYKWLWRWRTGFFLLEIMKNGGKKKGNEPLLTRARQHVWLRAPTSALRNGWAVCHAAGGNAWNCPGLYEGSSCRLCWWYLEIHPLLTWCCFNCSVGEQKNILSLVMNYPGGNNEMSWSSFGPASVSNVAKSKKAKSWKEKNSSLSE